MNQSEAMKIHISDENVEDDIQYTAIVKKCNETTLVYDTLDDLNAVFLPNSVQLVESTRPFSKAVNRDELSGMFLFRQILSLVSPFECLICKNHYHHQCPHDLAKHYHTFHGLTVHINKAEFSVNIQYLNPCYKIVKVVPETDHTGIDNCFYCALCGYASQDFSTHQYHTKVVHRMLTSVCFDCNLQKRPDPRLQCLVCSVYVYREDRLAEHILLSHVVQTGPKIWSCAMCLFAYGNIEEVLNHIPSCPKLQLYKETKLLDACGNSCSINQKYDDCSLRFSFEEKIKGLDDMNSDIEDCCFESIVPNSVQLVESAGPLSEANDFDKLSGMFLFRQIFSKHSLLQCLFCKSKYPLGNPDALIKHYRIIHKLNFNWNKIEFNENIQFHYTSSDIKEDSILKDNCVLCDATLKTHAEINDHYFNVHNKRVRLVPEDEIIMTELSFNCSLCENASFDFITHCHHMKAMHKMRAFMCPYCEFCTSKPRSLEIHLKQNHLQNQLSGPHFQCLVCSVYVHGKDRFTEHIVLSHTVQTGFKVWSCALCLYSSDDPHELVNHIPSCSELLSHQDTETHDGCGIPYRSFIACSHCSFTCIHNGRLEQHIKAVHETEKTIPVDVHHKVQYDPENFDCNTCFLCGTWFTSEELCRKHQHHVHMHWVCRNLIDYSKVDNSGLCQTEDEIALTLQKVHSKLILKNSLKNNDGALNITDSKQLEMNRESLICDPDLQCEDTLTHKKTEESSEYKYFKNIDGLLDCLNDDHKLSEIGFSKKAGHFCHLCDTVIKNYQLYYLHMCQLHQMEKRFQCIITSCSKTFSNLLQFQEHTITHSQKSECYCSVCDSVFSDDKELQKHAVNSNHIDKYLQMQIHYNQVQFKFTDQEAGSYFINLVRDKFIENELQTYKDFLSIILEFKAGRIDTYMFILQVTNILYGHLDLLEGFHYCCPPYETLFNEQIRKQNETGYIHSSPRNSDAKENYICLKPFNYQCKICHHWFGLFAHFVEHMETENHRYFCHLCGCIFVNTYLRKNHLQSFHTDGLFHPVLIGCPVVEKQ